MKCRIMRHFIWVFTVCQSARLGVSAKVSFSPIFELGRLANRVANLQSILQQYLDPPKNKSWDNRTFLTPFMHSLNSDTLDVHANLCRGARYPVLAS